MQPDRSKDVMMSMWGTDRLVTDYTVLTPDTVTQEKKKTIQEIMHDDIPKGKFNLTEKIHSKIRNDEDYDDWEYGTEPSYGKSW
jgi:hypothetical protein